MTEAAIGACMLALEDDPERQPEIDHGLMGSTGSVLALGGPSCQSSKVYLVSNTEFAIFGMELSEMALRQEQLGSKYLAGLI